MRSKVLLQKLINKQDLSEPEAFGVAEAMLSGSLTNLQIAGFLVALAAKGESVVEIIGLIKAMRENMLALETALDAIDVCGTGGDEAKTFNISTAVAFVVAGGGVKVAKHGNRAASSKCGSADVLEALGVNINLNQKQAVKVLQSVGLVFLFAPFFHPAFKNVAPARKELGIKTIFNYIGPFANPAGVKRQLIGVPSMQLARKLADVAKQLDYEHLLIVTSEDGLDEISPFGRTTMFEVKGKKSVKREALRLKQPHLYLFEFLESERSRSRRPEPRSRRPLLKGEGKLDAKRYTLDALKGGSPLENARIIKNILSGEKGAKRDIVVLNTAYALYVAGKVNDPREGIKLAEDSINSGSAKRVLGNLIKETKNYATS